MASVWVENELSIYQAFKERLPLKTAQGKNDFKMFNNRRIYKY